MVKRSFQRKTRKYNGRQYASGPQRPRRTFFRKQASFNRRLLSPTAPYRMGGFPYGGPEMKCNELIATDAQMVSTGAPVGFLLNGIASGTTVNQRIGNRIFAKMLQCRILYDTWDSDDPSGTAADSVMTTTLVLDRQANGGTPNYGDGNFGFVNAASFVPLGNMSRIKILKKDTMQIGRAQQSAAVTGEFGNDATPMRVKYWNIPLNHIVQYSTTGGDAGAITTNQLVIWFALDGMKEVGTSRRVWFYMRYWYTDA